MGYIIFLMGVVVGVLMILLPDIIEKIKSRLPTEPTTEAPEISTTDIFNDYKRAWKWFIQHGYISQPAETNKYISPKGFEYFDHIYMLFMYQFTYIHNYSDITSNNPTYRRLFHSVANTDAKLNDPDTIAIMQAFIAFRDDYEEAVRVKEMKEKYLV